MHNHKQLLEDIMFYFDSINCKPGHTTTDGADHGRIETQNIWLTTELNEYLNFPHVDQAFMVERIAINKKTDKESREIAYGITSKTPEQASAVQVLQDNRKHWSIELPLHH